MPAVPEISGKYAGRGGDFVGAGDLRVSADSGEQSAEVLCVRGCAQCGEVHPAQYGAGDTSGERERVEHPLAEPG